MLVVWNILFVCGVPLTTHVLAPIEACTGQEPKEQMLGENRNYICRIDILKLGYLTFRIHKLNNNIILEDVDLFNTRDSVHSYSFQGALKPFVICGCSLVDCLLLPATNQISL